MPPLSSQRPPPRPLLARRAMSTTRPAAASMSGSPGRSPDPAPPANGPMPPTGEHGDLIDLIAGNRGLASFRDACHEARRFLSLPPVSPERSRDPPAPRNSPEAARRLFRAGSSHHRHAGRSLSPRARHHRASRLAVAALSPRALVPERRQRAPRSPGRACSPPSPIPRPHHRRASHLARPRASRQGAACRSAPGARPSARQWRALRLSRRSLPSRTGVLLAGEGIETVLSLKSVLPGLPMIAALSANHLAALDLAPCSRGSTSPATAMPPAAWPPSVCMRAAARRTSRSAISCRCGATSTRTSAGSAPACSGASRRSARAGRCPALPRPQDSA